MDDNKKSESGSLTKRHFSKLHDRIQNKYAQMQRRIEKSRSMESISSLNEDFIFDNQCASVLSESKDDEEFADRESEKPVKYSIIFEDVSKQDAVAMNCEEILLYESEVTSKNREDKDDTSFFGSDLSLDNVCESTQEEKECEDFPCTPPHKVTVREKILAAKERLKEQRDKKKESKRIKSDRESTDKPDKIVLSNKPALDVSKKKNKVASVTVALIEATGPENEAALDEKARQYYCRIRLGQEKYKTKTIKRDGNLVTWQELCNLNLFEEFFLEVTMWEKEKDVFIGRTTVDLSVLKHDKTHRINLNLEDGDSSVQLLMLVTVSGTSHTNNIDLYDYEKTQKDILQMKKNVSWLLLHDDFDHVGWLSLIVYGAKGLSGADCFAAFILGNDRVQTHTEHKTHDPNWMKMYTFSVLDATSILYITIYDEKKSEIVGRAAIPLLKINNGEKKWYALKDGTMRTTAKGNNPRILLEMNFFYNVIKASIRVLNPKQKILLETEPEFDRHLLAKNIARTKAVIDWITEAFRIIKTLFEWESQRLNLMALTAWLIFWWFYEAWMLPLLLLFPFFWYRPAEYYFTRRQSFGKEQPARCDPDNISVVSLKEGKSSSSIIQKLNSLTDMVTTVQNGIGTAASLGESVKNLFNFTVPLLSVIAIFGILIISFVIYLIPCKYIVMSWGIHKFLRKTLRPNRTPNNEILDLLSRVPDDMTLRECKELPLPHTEKDKIFNST